MPSLFEELLEEERRGAAQPMPQRAIPPATPQPQTAVPGNRRTSMFEEDYGTLESNYTPPPGDEGSVSGFLGNVYTDVKDIAGGMYQLVRHPVQTAQAVAENPYALAEPYVEMAKDPTGYAYERPVSALMNVSLGTGALGLAAKAGKAGTVASKLGAVSRATDPVRIGTGAIGGLYKGAKRGVQLASGGYSATYRAPVVAAEMGYKSAWSGLANKLGYDVSKGPEKFQQHLRERAADPKEGYNIVQKGKEAIRNKAQTEIDTELAPLYADRKPFNLKFLNQSFKDARDKVYYGGSARSDAAATVLKELEGEAKAWFKMPVSTTVIRKNPAALATSTKGITKQMVQDIGGDPATMTRGQFAKVWRSYKQSAQGLDALKRKLDDVHKGYNRRTMGGGDALSRQASAIVVDSIKNTLRTRYGSAYDTAMAKYGDKMRLLKEVEETFGTTADTVSRRLTASNRDTVFADFGNRAKVLQRFAEEAGIPADVLPAIISGRTSRGWIPRGGNLGMGLAGGSAAGLAYLAGSPLPLLLTLAHLPRLTAETAYYGGKLEGTLVKPLRLVEGALNKVGVTRPVITQTAGQVSRAADDNTDNKNRLVAGLQQAAKQSGQNIHPRVIDSMATKLLSQDIDEVLKGLKTLSGHERLKKLFEAYGTKGER